MTTFPGLRLEAGIQAPHGERDEKELRLALSNILKQKVAFGIYYIRTFALVPQVLTALCATLSVGPNLDLPFKSLHPVRLPAPRG